MSFDEMTPEQIRLASKKAAWKWGAFVVVFLTMQVAIGAVAIILATGDESVAVVPDYYEKGLKWDEEVAMRQASDRLNWTHQLLIGETPDPSGRRSLVLRLVDANGEPIHDAVGKLEFYHHARAAQVETAELQSLGGGSYQSLVPINRDGLWEIGIEFQLAEPPAHYVATQTVVIGRESHSNEKATL